MSVSVCVVCLGYCVCLTARGTGSNQPKNKKTKENEIIEEEQKHHKTRNTATIKYVHSR